MIALRFKLAALQELNEAVAEFESREAGLGARFAGDVFRALGLALQSPEMHPEQPPGVRRIALRNFPYTIYYRLATDRLTVQAVLHGHINPNTRDSKLKP